MKMNYSVNLASPGRRRGWALELTDEGVSMAVLRVEQTMLKGRKWFNVTAAVRIESANVKHNPAIFILPSSLYQRNTFPL